MIIRQGDEIKEVYFLVELKINYDGKGVDNWKPWRRVITKNPTLEGIRKHIPEFPPFEILPPSFNFHKRVSGTHERWYSIVPFDSADSDV